MPSEKTGTTPPLASRPASGAALRLDEALAAAPVLRRLGERMGQSSACLEAVRPLLPPGLRPAVQAGPIEDGVWCLIVPTPAAAGKIRQMLPLLLERLQSVPLPVCAIRLATRRER